MPRALPIFPLGIVLLPGTPRALHIFEPRYRQLVRDCLAGDGRFGIAYIDAEPVGIDAEPVGTDAVPAPGQVGCVANIRHSEELPDGRSDIVTMGERRFVIEAWVEADRLYRVARVREFDDDAEDAAELQLLGAGLGQAFLRLHDALAALGDQTPDAPGLPPQPDLLSFYVAAALDLEPATQQNLLEMRSASGRLRRLEPLVARLAGDAERRAVVHRGARGNGKGGSHPSIEGQP